VHFECVLPRKKCRRSWKPDAPPSPTACPIKGHRAGFSPCRCDVKSPAETGGTVAGERIMRNLAQLLADRLIVANAKVNLLTAS
jgi:hypothetical protein